jgi:uncharacterized protein (TIGR03435 family)
MKMIARIVPMLLAMLPGAAQTATSSTVSPPYLKTAIYYSNGDQTGHQFQPIYELKDTAMSGEFQTPTASRTNAQSSIQSSGSSSRTLETLANIRDAWIQDFTTKKLELVVKFYAPDAVFLQPTGERISGTVALRNLFQTIMATFNSDITLYSQNLETSGDLAYDSGSFRENLVTIATGAKITSTGSYIIIFKHQSNGSWQIVQHVWTGIPLPAGGEARTPTYDVVSIKPNKSGSGRTSISDNNDSFSATNISLKTLLVNAYDVRDYLISGLTGWANSDRFDVNAKIVDKDTDALKKLTDEQRNAMLQQVLADRFQMKVHLQTEVLPIYAKSGPKITAVEPIGPDPDADKNRIFKGMSRGNMRVSNTELAAHDVQLDSLAYALSGRLSRTVVDKTGLKGKFDLSLTWLPDDEARAAADSSAPSLFTALQEQLGLRLQPAKGPVETLVVDHVEKPSEN